MSNQEEKESVSPIVRIIMELLSPGGMSDEQQR